MRRITTTSIPTSITTTITTIIVAAHLHSSAHLRPPMLFDAKSEGDFQRFQRTV
jgi:hypothetical protein